MVKKETAEQTEDKIFGLVGMMFLEQALDNSKRLQELREQLGYSKGFEEGHLAGYRQAQADACAAKYNLDFVMGLVKLPEYE